MKFAILDFGTNTFNLLVAETDERKGFRILYSGKEAVKLGKGGINNKHLTPEAMERGITAVERHMKTIEHYGSPQVRAFATSAVRSAENGQAYMDDLKKRFGFITEVIPGEREAELIYKGVRLSGIIPDSASLILDIGGGSNEFILCDPEKVYWKQSFDLGMARILDKFPMSDPISTSEIRELEDYFESELGTLFDAVGKYNPSSLVGASGSFETFAEIIRLKNGKEVDGQPARIIEMEEYQHLHKVLLGSTLAERKVMPGMEPVRVEMIVAASIFVSFVLRKCELTQLLQTDYALKEGVIAEIIES